ncbi:MAG: hypothetical protein U0359_35685 [Byssovorax sp.]
MAAFSSDDLIQLPRLTGGEASLLIAELLAVATQAGPLPAAIERSRGRLDAAARALSSALKGSVEPVVPAAVRRRAERAATAAWEATSDWLSGWCKLEGEKNPHRQQACDLFALLFPALPGEQGRPGRVEIESGSERLARLDRDGDPELFTLLGGQAFLDQLRKAQRSLDLTAGAPREDAAAVREQIAAAAAALRQYLVRVSSHADPDIPGSEALAESLMRPLSRFHWMHPSRGPHTEYGKAEETQY